VAQEKTTFSLIISGGQMDPLRLASAARFHRDFLQLRWKTTDPLHDFFYSYVGKTGFSTVTPEITT
jgi:hypothetical protein